MTGRNLSHLLGQRIHVSGKNSALNMCNLDLVEYYFNCRTLSFLGLLWTRVCFVASLTNTYLA